jgi:hypothetical protein
LERYTHFFSTAKRPLENKMSLLNLASYDLQEVSLSKTTSTLTGKQCARWACFSHRFFSLDTFLFFSTLPEKAYLEQRATISRFKPLTCMKYSFQNLNRFSQETIC